MFTFIQTSRFKRGTINWVLLLSLFSSFCLSADEDADKARKAYVERFIRFTQDENVAGRAKDPFGKVVTGGAKSRFNKDDGNSYQGALTYHDVAYSTKDEEAAKQNPNDPKAQNRFLSPFVSSHGGVSKEGGSSELERAVYEKHVEYSKKDEDPEAQKQRDKEKGIRNFSIFTQETRELEPNPQNPDQPKSVRRVSINPEVASVIEQVGKDSFQTIERSAKEPGSENDQKLMGNLTFYREAAARGSKALWDSTLANLSQRRVFRNGEGSLSESAPNCESWGESENQEIQKKFKDDPEQLQTEQERLQKRIEKCRTMENINWSAIDPEIEENDGKLEVKEKGVNFEDSYARDLRNQMEVMDKVGINPEKLQTNWKYSEDEFKNEVLSEDGESGEVTSEQMTNAEQLNAYNQALELAVEKFNEVKKVSSSSVPNFDEQSIQAYRIQAGEKSILEINKVPQQMMEEMGAPSSDIPTANNYSELIQEQNASTQ